MENLNLPEINLAYPPEFNMKKYSYFNLKPDTNRFFYSIPQFFSAGECIEIIKLGKSFIIDESGTGSTEDGKKGISEIRRSYNSWIPPCTLSFWIYEKIAKAIQEANYFFNFDLSSIENLQFTRYEESISGGYNLHTDSFLEPSSTNSHRKLSFSIQLSHYDNYEGGKLLLYPHGKDPTECSNELGTIIFFPSNIIHTVTTVTKGIRYSLVSWISGPKFK